MTEHDGESKENEGRNVKGREKNGMMEAGRRKKGCMMRTEEGENDGGRIEEGGRHDGGRIEEVDRLRKLEGVFVRRRGIYKEDECIRVI